MKMKMKLKQGRARKYISSKKTGNMKVWQNNKGEWCIGNKCFRMTATDEGVVTRFNTRNPSCPVEMQTAAKNILESVQSGKEARFIMPKPPPDGEEW